MIALVGPGGRAVRLLKTRLLTSAAIVVVDGRVDLHVEALEALLGGLHVVEGGGFAEFDARPPDAELWEEE